MKTTLGNGSLRSGCSASWFEPTVIGYPITMESDISSRNSHESGGEPASILLIADPGEPTKLATRMAERLPQQLRGRDERPRLWTTTVRSKPYFADEQAALADVIDAVDPAAEKDDVVVYLTDLPRREDTLPIVGEVSPDHRFALVSIVGLGGINIERRVSILTELVVAQLFGEPDLSPPYALRRISSAPAGTGVRYFAPRGLRRFRLLAGMVRANRPWRLANGLSKAMAGAFATGAIALATSTIWQFADLMGPWRMSAATILSVTAMILWLIIDHELWERPDNPDERERSILYNIATVVTLVIGVVAFHIALFCLMLFTASITLPPSLLSQTLGHPVNIGDYLTLSWLLASIATIGGALGSGLEDDDAVRKAAYGVRQRERLDDAED